MVDIEGRIEDREELIRRDNAMTECPRITAAVTCSRASGAQFDSESESRACTSNLVLGVRRLALELSNIGIYWNCLTLEFIDLKATQSH